MNVTLVLGVNEVFSQARQIDIGFSLTVDNNGAYIL